VSITKFGGNNWRARIRNIRDFIFTIISTIITALALLAINCGLIDVNDNKSMLNAILIVLLALAVNNISNRVSENSELDVISNALMDIKKSVEGHAYHHFDSGAEAHRYFATRLVDSKEILHASVGPYEKEQRPEYKADFDKALEKAIKNGSAYRYVTMVGDNLKQERINKWLKLLNKRHQVHDDPVGIGTYKANIKGTPPTMFFMIADNELMIRCPNERGQKDEYYIITHEYVISIFKKYHDQLWQNSEKSTCDKRSRFFNLKNK